MNGESSGESTLAHASAIVALPCFDQTVAFRWSGDPRDREDPMKAIVQERYGSADVLELKDIDQPELGGDEVLVRVLAASAHIGDWHFMTACRTSSASQAPGSA